MSARVNTFKAFIDKSKEIADKPPVVVSSSSSKNVKPNPDPSGIEAGMMDLSLLAMGDAEAEIEAMEEPVAVVDSVPIDDTQPDPVSTDVDQWVQYLDDETGMPYWYNELTGEARWAEEYQTTDENAPQVQVDGGAWERFYDDDGNPYYYNHETGQSDWEIPANAVLINTSNNVEDEDVVGYMRGEDLEQSQDSLKSALKKGPSFKSVRSARSFGLTSKSFKITTFSDKVTFIHDQVSLDRMSSSKSLKSTLSFKLNKSPSFVVNNQLKPKTPTPHKSKAKNGFQILKEGASILREKRGQDGVLWREYQAVDDGPIFYATEEAESGQWGKPDVFFEKTSKSRHSRGDDSGSITPESSLEMSNEVVVVDFFALDKDDVFDLKTPQPKLPVVDTKKTTPISIAMLTEHSNPESSPVFLPVLNTTSGKEKVEPFSPQPLTSSRLSSASSSSQKLTNKIPSGSKLIPNSQISSKEPSVVSKDENQLQPLMKPEPSVTSSQNPTPTSSATTVTPPTAITLKIKNIQDEAMLELQRLRSKLDSAKQDLKIANPVDPSTPAPSVKSVDVNPAPIVFTANKVSSNSGSARSTPVVSAKPSSENILVASESKEPPSEPSTPVVEKKAEANVAPVELKTIEESKNIAATSQLSSIVTKVTEEEKEEPNPEPVLTKAAPLQISTESSVIKKRPEVVLEENPFNFLDTPVKPKKDINKISQSEWMEIVCRSQMIDMKNGWLVLYDLELATKFYRRMSDGFCQVNEPEALSAEVKKEEEEEVVVVVETKTPEVTEVKSKAEINDNKVAETKPIEVKPLSENKLEENAKPSTSEGNLHIAAVNPSSSAPAPAPASLSSTFTQPASVVVKEIPFKTEAPITEDKPSISTPVLSSLPTTVSKVEESKVLPVESAVSTPSKVEEVVKVTPITAPVEETKNESLPIKENKPSEVIDVIQGGTTTSPTKSAKKKKEKVVVDPLSADFHNFPVTGNKQTDLHIDIEHSAFTASPLASNKSNSTPILESTKKPAFSMETMIEDLAYVEKKSASNFHAFLQKDYQNQDNEANLLLQRLQALHTNRLTATEATIGVTELEEDEVKKLHGKCRKLMERCCYVMESIDMTNLEHMINSKQLFRAAVHQRYALASSSSAVRDLRHDAAVMRSTPKHMISPSSVSLTEYWKTRKTYQAHHSAWYVYMNTHEVYASLNANPSHGSGGSKKQAKKWYRNKHVTQSIQCGEPFDFFMMKSSTQMKRELWSDYIVNAFVDQHLLEHMSIELLEDAHHGYLYYCPIRKEYSSHGRFHPFPKSKSKQQVLPTISSSQDPTSTVHDWSQRIHQHRLQKLIKSSKHQNVWKQFDLSSCAAGLQDDTVFGQSTSRNTSTQGRQQVHQSLDKYRTSFKSQQRKTISKSPSKRMSFNKLVEEEHEEEEEESAIRPSAWLAKEESTLPYNADNWTVLQDAFAIANQDFTTLKYSASDVAAFRLYDTTAVGSNSHIHPATGGDTFMTSVSWHLEKQDNNAEAAAAQQQQQEEEELHRMLKFEEHLSADSYTKYQQMIFKISMTDPENPLPVLELMEFLLYEGLGKAALAVFKHATDMMKASNTFEGMQYEYALGHLLSMQLSRRYFNYYENYNHILTLLHMYGTESVFVLTMCAAYFQSLHLEEMAESLYLAALMKEPNSIIALLKYAQFVAMRGDWKTALRYYHRLHDANPSNHPSNHAMHAMLRLGRLEEAWLQELLQVDSEGIIVAYKKCIGMNVKDRMQSAAMHSLASFQHSLLKPKASVLEYYHRAIQVSEDNAIAHLLLAAYSTVHQAQHKAQTASALMHQLNPSSSTLSNSLSQGAVSNATTGKRPLSAKATAGASKKTAQESESNKSKSKASNARPSSAAPIGNAVNIATSITSTDTHDPQYAPWNKAHIDSSYRRALVLMPDASYRWMALLSYADFILLSLQDVQRAKEYYQEASRLSFHTEISPILALGHCYHYTLQDYRRAKKVYLRALRSRHGNQSIIDLANFDNFHKPIKSSQGIVPDDTFEYLGPPMSPVRNNSSTSQRVKIDLDYEQSLVPSSNRLDCIPLYTAIAYLLWDMNEIEAAKRFAMASLRLQRSFSPALRLIGLISFFQQDIRLAAKYFSAAASSAYSHSHQQDDNHRATNYSAANMTTSALQKSMNNVLALRCHGMMKAIKGSYDQAIQLLDKSITASPLCYLTHRVNAVLSYVYKQQVDKAYLHLQQAYDISQRDDIEALRFKAQILMDQKQYEEARMLLLDIIEKVPYDVISFVNIAWCVQYMNKALKRSQRSSASVASNAFHPFATQNTIYNTEDDEDDDFFNFYDSKLHQASNINHHAKKIVFNRETLIGHNLLSFAQSKDPKELLEIAKSLAILLTDGGSQPYAEGLLQHMIEVDRKKVPSTGLPLSTDGLEYKAVFDDSKHSDTSMMAYVYFWYAVYYFNTTDSQSQSSLHYAKQYFQLAAYPSLAANHLGHANSQYNSIPFESMNHKDHRQDRANNTYYSLAIYYLGLVAENEGNISEAERYYEEAVRSAAKHPFALLRIIAMTEDALLSVRDKLHKKSGKKLKKKKKTKSSKKSSKAAANSLLRDDGEMMQSEADVRGGMTSSKSLSAMEPSVSKMDIHPQPSNSSSSYFDYSQPLGQPQSSTIAYLHQPRVGIAGTEGYFTPARDSLQDMMQYNRVDANQIQQLNGKSSSVLNLNSVSRGSVGTGGDLSARQVEMSSQPQQDSHVNEGNDAEEEEGDDEEDDDEFDALHGFEREPALTMKDLQQDPVRSEEVANLLKRVMMHQRILEAALVHKFSSQKSMKDLAKVTIPKKTFIHLEHDWLERALYAYGKAEDWATMYLSMKEAVL